MHRTVSSEYAPGWSTSCTEPANTAAIVSSSVNTFSSAGAESSTWMLCVTSAACSRLWYGTSYERRPHIIEFVCLCVFTLKLSSNSCISSYCLAQMLLHSYLVIVVFYEDHVVH